MNVLVKACCDSMRGAVRETAVWNNPPRIIFEHYNSKLEMINFCPWCGRNVHHRSLDDFELEGFIPEKP